MSDYVLRTRAMSKKYGNSFALENVSLDIKRGHVYGLIGLNGAGKTTFMRGVMGLITLTAGEVELFGKMGKRELEWNRRRIGQCIESPAINPNMTAEQNLNVQRIMAGVTDKDAVGKALKTVGLEDTGKKNSKDFSYGMKQRLAIATALISNPEFLILDEPANGFDPKGIIEMRSLLLCLNQKQGLALLVSSHLHEKNHHSVTTEQNRFSNMNKTQT